MTIHPLGNLKRDPEFKECLESAPVAVPYFDGRSMPFMLIGMEDDAAPGDFESAMTAFFSLDSADRERAGQDVFKYYQQFVAMIGEKAFSNEIGVSISSAAAVWDYVTPTSIQISRMEGPDEPIYVEILAECQWDVEHGLAVIYECGSRLSRVGDQS